jgi:hypothetical protein
MEHRAAVVKLPFNSFDGVGTTLSPVPLDQAGYLLTLNDIGDRAKVITFLPRRSNIKFKFRKT